jgi:hypothetical protein
MKTVIHKRKSVVTGIHSRREFNVWKIPARWFLPVFTLLVAGQLLLTCSPGDFRTIMVSPGQSVRDAIDRASAGDTIVLRDGIYHEKITINKPVVLRALNGGEAMLTNRYAGKQLWQRSDEGDGIWYMGPVSWPVHWLLVDGYYKDSCSGTAPDLGALESDQDLDSWRALFGHCGPAWINSANAPEKAPNRPVWPDEIDPGWGGLE